ncbi:MAG: hypothetical protein CMJ49_08515 [Planctomycetaceae bacterium]|nr:hypothetical protein [Planctomycetaceae bacterium]
MGWQIDTDMHWTDHYVEHGFCVIRQAVPRAFCEEAIAALQKELRTDLPPSGWNSDTIDDDLLAQARDPDKQSPELHATLSRIYEEPNYRGLVDTMFGEHNGWGGKPHAHTFISLKDMAAGDREPSVSPWGHLDFVNVHIPMFGDGFTSQVSLVKSEPFSGNITIYPGLHKVVQKLLLDDRDFRFLAQGHPDWHAVVPQVEPYEFVADPGDVLFFHHLVGHAGNGNMCASGAPRVAIHAHVYGQLWPNGVDPDEPGLSPWLRSHAHNGKFELAYNDREMTMGSKAVRAERNAAAK